MLARIFVCFFLAFAAFAVNAQVHGTQGYDPQRRIWLPPGVPIPQHGNPGTTVVVPGVPAGAILVPQGASVPTGYCTWQDRVANIAISAGVGALIGALAGDSSRAAGQGAAAGGMVGVFVPCPTPVAAGGARVVSPLAPQESGFLCAIEGVQEVFPVKTRETCGQIAGQIARAKSGTQPTSPPNLTPPAVQTSVGNPSDTQKNCSHKLAQNPSIVWMELDWPGHPQHGKKICSTKEQVEEDKKRFASAP